MYVYIYIDMPPPALHNPNEMGSGTYELISSKTSKTNKTKNNQPNPNLDKEDSVKNNRRIQNLGTMKDNIPPWRINKDTGVESFWYQDKASKDRNTRGFENMNNPPFQRREGKELAAFSENYDPNEEGEGIWFGGITKSRKKNTKRVSRKKNTTKSGKSGKSKKSKKSKSKKTMKKNVKM